MKKQLLALALVAGIGTATWSAEGHATNPTAQIGYVVGYVVGRGNVGGWFSVYYGMRYGAVAGVITCRNTPALYGSCAAIGAGVGAR